MWRPSCCSMTGKLKRAAVWIKNLITRIIQCNCFGRKQSNRRLLVFKSQTQVVKGYNLTHWSQHATVSIPFHLNVGVKGKAAAPFPSLSQPSSHFARQKNLTRLCYSNWKSWLYGWVWQAGQLSQTHQKTAWTSEYVSVCRLLCYFSKYMVKDKCAISVLFPRQTSCAWVFGVSLFSTDPRGPREAWGNRCWRAAWAV